jgi:hypothetical protein
VLTVACNKDEDPVINPCLNGQLDSGETAVDCGGNCGACPETEFPSAGFIANGVALTASTKQLTYNNGWTLNLATDSITLQLNLGNNGAVGTYAMSPVGSTSSIDGVNYSTLTNGTYSISAHNTTSGKLSGFFQGKFVRIPGDTLYITNGYFHYLPY